MNERQSEQAAKEVRAWHVFKSLTGKVISKEPITPGKSIPFGSDCFTENMIEFDPEGEQLQIVKRIIGREEIVAVVPIKRSLEKFSLFGKAPREEIIIEK